MTTENIMYINVTINLSQIVFPNGIRNINDSTMSFFFFLSLSLSLSLSLFSSEIHYRLIIEETCSEIT